MRTMMIAVVGLLACTATAQAAEISALSGVYRSEENKEKESKTDLGKKTTINVGGRFAEPIEGHLFWLAQGALTLRSYDKGDLQDAPSSSTSLNIGGGVRWYFNKLSESFSPYVNAIASYKSEKDADIGSTGYTETESNGLYYGGDFGIRISLQKEFFVDLETSLFESPLFATETQRDYDATGKKTTELEKKRTELYVNSTGLLDKVVLAIGMRL